MAAGRVKGQTEWGTGTQDLASSGQMSQMHLIPNTIVINSIKRWGSKGGFNLMNDRRSYLRG